MLAVSLFAGILMLSGCLTPQTPSSEEILNNPDEAIAVCGEMEEPDKGDCYLAVSSNLTQAELFDKAMESCGMMEEPEECYTDLQSALSDAGLFDNMMELCGKVEGPDGCYYDLAMESQMIAACRNISRKREMMECLFELASQNNNTEACKAMPDKSDRDNCIFDLAEQTKSAEICSEIESDLKRGGCLRRMSEVLSQTDPEKALESCENMARKDDCYWDVVHNVKAGNPDVALTACSRLSANANDCYFNVVRSLLSTDVEKALSVCRRMEYDYQKNDCYFMIVETPEVTLSDPDLAIETCGELTTNADSCYETAAKIISEEDKEKAVEACSHITNEGIRGGCEQDFG